MFGFKKKPEPKWVKNNKPLNAQYKIVLGRDIKIGDIVVYSNQRYLVKSCSKGNGAGSFDFGTYIVVHAERLTGQVGFLEKEFWTYETCPMIVEYQDET